MRELQSIPKTIHIPSGQWPSDQPSTMGEGRAMSIDPHTPLYAPAHEPTWPCTQLLTIFSCYWTGVWPRVGLPRASCSVWVLDFI